jgi:hypothetical protein
MEEAEEEEREMETDDRDYVLITRVAIRGAYLDRVGPIVLAA